MEESATYNSQQTGEITLKDVILKLRSLYRYLMSKWIFIALWGAIFAGLGFAYSLIKKPLYTATTTFVLEDSDTGGGLGQFAGVASMAGLDLGGGAGGVFQGDNILQLYSSRTMIEKTLLSPVIYNGKKQFLIDRYIEFNKLRGEWDKKPELVGIKFEANDATPEGLTHNRLRDSLIGTIVDDINKNVLSVTKPDKKLNIIKADVKSTDEFFAEKFDMLIVENVNTFYTQTKTKKSMASIAILQHKTDSVRAMANGAIYSAAVISDNTPNLNITRQVQRAAPLQKSQLIAEMNKGVLAELVKNLELSKITLLKEAPLIQIIDQPVLPLAKQKLGKAKGLVLGGILGCFLSAFYFIIRKILRAVMA